VIRWITPQLATGAWDTVSATEDLVIIDVRALVDRDGNTPQLVRAKIDETLAQLRLGRKVVICCDYGMSRSNAVAAGVLACSEGLSVEEATRRIIEATRETAIRIELLEAVRQAIGAKPATEALEGKIRLLITGAAGFVGSAVRRLLRPEYEIVTPTRTEVDLVKGATPLHLACNLQSANTLLHLATPRVYTTNEAMGESIVMLKNVLDVCATNRIRLIYLSSWEVFSGYQARELRADENFAPRPGGTYGQAKMLSEQLIQHFHHKHGLEYTILRSSPAYGVHGDRPKFIWNFLHAAIRGDDITTHRYRNGSPHLDLLHVDDLARAVCASIDRRYIGVLNLGTGVATSTSDVAQWLVTRLGSKSKLRFADIEGFASNVVMDTRHAQAILGWTPAKHLNEGLEEIVQRKLEANIDAFEVHHGEFSAQ